MPSSLGPGETRQRRVPERPVHRLDYNDLPEFILMNEPETLGGHRYRDDLQRLHINGGGPSRIIHYSTVFRLDQEMELPDGNYDFPELAALANEMIESSDLLRRMKESPHSDGFRDKVVLPVLVGSAYLGDHDVERVYGPNGADNGGFVLRDGFNLEVLAPNLYVGAFLVDNKEHPPLEYNDGPSI